MLDNTTTGHELLLLCQSCAGAQSCLHNLNSMRCKDAACSPQSVYRIHFNCNVAVASLICVANSTERSDQHQTMLSQILHRGQFAARHVVSISRAARHSTIRLACLPQNGQQRPTAASAAAVEPAPVPGAAADSSNPDSRPDRKPKRKPSSPQPSTVLREAAAAVGGALPHVLCATLPETFPTLSAARRGAPQDQTQWQLPLSPHAMA
jgi:hypothetical protein